jgi:hypothetical protein
MKERRMTEKTKVTLSILTLVGLILFIITSTTAAITWKVDVDNKIKACIEKSLENETKQEAIDKSFIEIKTDLKWIRAALEKLEKNMPQ